MTTVIDQPLTSSENRFRPADVWRIVRLHAVNPSVFFGIPSIILGGAWVITMLITIIFASGSGQSASADDLEGMRYSWAVLSPQWYLVAVGVQAIGLTFSFALGFGATRRDFWLGTSLMFLLVSVVFATAIATLVQVEIATGGWGLGAHMFDALWYGQTNWLVDFYTTFALQLLVLFIGASVTTVYMRWRMRGMIVLMFASAAVVIGTVATITLINAWPTVFGWLGGLGIVGAFTVVLGFAALFAVLGYVVIRRATPR
jgi:hypothetical protein